MKVDNFNMHISNNILLGSRNAKAKGIKIGNTSLGSNDKKNNHITSMIEQKQQMEKRLDEMKDNQRKHILDLENQISDIQSQISDVKKQITDISIQIQGVDGEIYGTNNKIDDVTNKIDDLQSKDQNSTNSEENTVTEPKGDLKKDGKIVSTKEAFWDDDEVTSIDGDVEGEKAKAINKKSKEDKGGIPAKENSEEGSEAISSKVDPELSKELEDLKKTKSSLEATKSSLEDTRDSLNSILKMLCGNLDMYKARLEEYRKTSEEEIEDYKKEIEEKNKKNGELKTDTDGQIVDSYA